MHYLVVAARRGAAIERVTEAIMTKRKNEVVANDLDVLSISDSMKIMRLAIDSDTPIHFIGPPGCGKSAIVESVAKEMEMPLETLLLSQCDPTDIGGFPTVNDNGALSRLPLGAIKRSCEEPVVLFLDELSCASPAVQGASLQLIYNRRAGDVRLHKNTRIVAASNPPDQSAGGWEIAPPLISRLTQIKMMPTISEVQAYFKSLGEPKSSLRMLSVDWAATVEVANDLIAFNPPAGCQTACAQWGAPRSWERALTLCSKILDSGLDDSSQLFASAVAGNVGPDSAVAYMTIRKIRSELPSVKEIAKEPNKAKLPSNIDIGVAVLGLVAQVAEDNPCPAWIYGNRITCKEIRIAVLNFLGTYGLGKHKNDPMYKEADAAQSNLLKDLGKAMRTQ